MTNPWSVQIELVEGCSRLCEFCGLRGVVKARGKQEIKMMQLDLAKNIASDFSHWLPKSRIEFAMCGEPLLHPDMIEVLRHYRELLPKTQLTITTNSDPIRKGLKLDISKIQNFFEAGLNVIMIDCYDGSEQYDAYLTQLKSSGLQVFDYYDRVNGANTVYSYHGVKHHRVVLTPDLSTASGKHRSRVICNHAGNVDPELGLKYGAKIIQTPLKLRCTKPFRELSIKHDGVVCGCCVDHCRELVMGKFPEENLKDIWFGDRFRKFRALLYRKNRSIIPCSRCDYDGGFRHGLLDNPNISTSDSHILNELSKPSHFDNFNYRKCSVDESGSLPKDNTPK